MTATPNNGADTREPLDGVRVLELGGFITGPYASMLLADMGASVIKVERPEGDPFRAFRDGLYSPNFVGFNRNKRSLQLDLARSDGRDALLQLADQVDVLIENFRPGVMESLGLGCDTLRARNPRLVYCAIAGFPPGSSYADRPAYDIIGQAHSGMLDVFLDPDNPEVRGPTISDQLAGMYAAYGVMGALAKRGRTGFGARVDVNMVESSMSFMPDFFASVTREGKLMHSTTRAAYSHTFAFRCLDGTLLGVQLSSPQKFWQALVRAVGEPGLATDPRFATRPARIANFGALQEALRNIFAKQPRAYWLEQLQRQDVPHAAVRPGDEVLSDTEMRAGGSFSTIVHPQMGEVTCIERPVLIDGTRPRTRLAPPTLGEHNGELMQEFGLALDACSANQIGLPRGPGPSA